jgi:hypothetical protein
MSLAPAEGTPVGSRIERRPAVMPYTCRGEGGGSVAASLLNAVGLPELVTNSLEDYESLAPKLATDDTRQSLRPQ